MVPDVGEMKVLSSELGAEDEEAFWLRGQRCSLFGVCPSSPL